MEILEDQFSKQFDCRTYIALGSFDGLHLGHMSLMNKAIELSKKHNSKSMVFTFRNHPLSTINKELVPKLVMDNNDKLKILDNIGIDIVNMVEFNEKFMKLSPEEFIFNIVKCYNAKGIVVGFNYRFGFKNLGDTELLKVLSKKYNFELHIVKPVKLKNQIVSSSNIRNAISEDGDIKKANRMLTRPFSLKGKVIKGRQIGREIGFPTINLDYDKKFLLPRGGVYFTIVRYKDDLYKGITNIGYNPTVENHKLSIETNILNFDKNIYDEEIKIYFMDRIRDEKKFDSIEDLSKQINKDKKFVQNQNFDLMSKSNLQFKFYLL